MDETFCVYTFDELLALVDKGTDFIRQWEASAPELSGIGEVIEARYGGWCCLYCDSDMTDAEIKAQAYGLYSLMTAWVKQYGPHYGELAGIEAKSSTKSVSKFNDTPETAGDYSGLEHTSTITANEAESTSYSEAMDKARMDAFSSAVNEFRRQFLTWEDFR